MKKLLPFAGALVATLAFIVLGGGALTGGLRLQVPNGSTTGAAPTTAAHGHDGAATTASKPLVLIPPADGSRLALTTAPAAKPEQGYLVSVKVTSPAGKPVGDAAIKFYDIVDLFGEREELIGSGTTDGQGSALISYLPATTGTHRLVARFAGQGTLVPSLGLTTLEATVAAPTYTVDQPGFASFAKYVPFGAGFLVLAVWGLIAFSLFATARGVIAGADRKIRKGETA